jgi:AmmeMemoRadiSam system protein A
MSLTQAEKLQLLQIARAALTAAVGGHPLPGLELDSLPAALREDGASFVTLTVGGALRGCIGTLQAYQPLALDVQTRAVEAALEDPRFSPVLPAELPNIQIEVSRLTAPKPLEYTDPAELIRLLRPGVDGVVLRDGPHRATFLPQVWSQLPEPTQFLDQLCYKMGSPSALWREGHPQVEIYQVEEFHE